MAKPLVVIQVPHHLIAAEMDALRERASASLGIDYRLLIVSGGVTARVYLPNKAD